MHVLITGATGFVGKTLTEYLLEKGLHVRAQTRNLHNAAVIHSNLQWVETGEITANTNWTEALDGVDVIVHLAQRAHVMKETSESYVDHYRKVNVEAFENLISQSVLAGTKKIIFLSSIKVNGEKTTTPFRESDIPAPEDFYGMTKLEAENVVKKYSARSELKYTIIRPPLIYGRNVPGNFKKLIGLAASGIPLPLKSIRNRRSLVGVVNLCDFIETCIRLPEASNETFLVSDDYDLSTPELISKISDAMNKKSRLIYFPTFLLRFLFLLTGKKNYSQRLLDSLQVNISKAKRVLNWNPPHTVDYDIRRAVRGFVEN